MGKQTARRVTKGGLRPEDEEAIRLKMKANRKSKKDELTGIVSHIDFPEPPVKREKRNLSEDDSFSLVDFDDVLKRRDADGADDDSEEQSEDNDIDEN